MNSKLVDLAVWSFIFGIFLATVSVIIGLVYVLFTKYYYITLVYVIYRLWDRHSPYRGGWRWRPLRTSTLVTDIFPSYFPARVHYTVSPETVDTTGKNFVAGIHPHGIIPVSGITGGLAVEHKHRGFRVTGTTHNASFFFPVVREVFLALGVCASSSESLDWLLSGKEGYGNFVAIFPGGARECLLAEPRTFKLVLKNRMGFVRKALEHGADLIPCVSFGDNEVYHKRYFAEGSKMRRIQDFLNRKTIPLLLCSGDGFLSILPRRIPLNLVIGAPIIVDKIASPTIVQVKELHAKYVQELVALYENNKSKFGYDDVPLELL